MTKIIDIEGVGPAYAKKLSGAGVKSVEALLKRGATPKGRDEVGKAAGIDHKLILEWVNLADLYRRVGRDADAETVLRAAAGVAPQDAGVHHALGLTLVPESIVTEHWDPELTCIEIRQAEVEVPVL